MTWKELTLKEKASIYKQARAISPDLTYFDIRDLFDSIPEKNNNVPTYSTGGIVDAPVATFGLPEVNIYPQNEFGDIARSQGINTARNWRTVKEGTTKGINDFYNDPRTQMVMAGLPMPNIMEASSVAVNSIKPIVKNIIGKMSKGKVQTFYHGSPFNFDMFDPREIGTAEGASKGMKGINLSETTKIAPKFANIKSPDAPIHLGKSRPTTKTIDPRIYTVTGKLNLKDIPKTKGFNQSDILAEGYDGVRIRYPNQVTVFPEAVNKLKIAKKQTIEEFIRSRPNDEFAEWTTTPENYWWLNNK